MKHLPVCRIHAVYEAGPTGYQLFRWLRELGCDAFMTLPSLVPVRKGERVKTDRRDSLKLAELLRAKKCSHQLTTGATRPTNTESWFVQYT